MLAGFGQELITKSRRGFEHRDTAELLTPITLLDEFYANES